MFQVARLAGGKLPSPIVHAKESQDWFTSEEGRPARLRWLHIVEDSALTNGGHHVGKGDWRRPYLQLVCVLSLTPDLAHWDKVPGRAAFPMGESAPLPSGASGQGQHAGGPCATRHIYP